MEHKDIITILDRMDLRMVQMQQSRAAFAQVREVLNAYSKTVEDTAAQEALLRELTEKVEAMKERCVNEEKTVSNRLDKHKAKTEAAVNELKQTRYKAEADIKEWEAKAAEAQSHAGCLCDELDAKCKEKQAQLDGLEQALERFKVKHGLVG